MIIYIIILILIILIPIFLYIYRENISLPKIRNYNRNIHINLKPLLKKVVDFFNKNKITYWIFSGTLLGHIRHDKKFIPHDDDIDLVVYGENIDEKFKTMEKNNIFKSNGLRIKQDFFGYKIFFNNSNIFIDIFIYVKNGNKIEAISEYTKKIFPNEYFIEDELFPLIKDKFEGIEVNIPKEPKKYLFRYYGSDCLKNIKYDIPHYEYLNSLDRGSIIFFKYLSKLFKNKI